jgi:superfamily II DNA or RNA helicase
VAATGTGKTVIAALDYKRTVQALVAEHPGRSARILFVAHREEILLQSLACFRAILRDQNFGDLLVGQHRPASLDHLFVSIQSFNARKLSENISPEFYDFVVLDEFHHAEAPSYRRLLEWVRPRILLGLTATPERADGLDVLHHFGGHICAEIRLPAAINRKLLCPFQYFGLSDTVDLSRLTWQRGGYLRHELERAYTRNEARADLVVRSVRDKLVDPLQTRGLGFCVSVAHAEYMAAYFQRCGIPAEAVSGETPADQRQTVQHRLINREIDFIFCVDLYSEARFHWQSQSTTSEHSATGQRYIDHEARDYTILLFVREEKKRNGLACPCDFLGPVSYENHSGSRPMSIVWRLQHPIPARLLPAALRMSAA